MMIFVDYRSIGGGSKTQSIFVRLINAFEDSDYKISK